MKIAERAVRAVVPVNIVLNVVLVGLYATLGMVATGGKLVDASYVENFRIGVAYWILAGSLLSHLLALFAFVGGRSDYRRRFFVGLSANMLLFGYGLVALFVESPWIMDPGFLPILILMALFNLGIFCSVRAITRGPQG